MLFLSRRTVAAVALPALTATKATAAFAVPPRRRPSWLKRAYPHHLTATPQSFHQVDNKPAGDSMGDEIVDTFALSRAGKPAGSVIQFCVLVAPARGVAQCSGTVAVRGGRLTIGGGRG